MVKKQKQKQTKNKYPWQGGTGLHIDMNIYNRWFIERDQFGNKQELLDRWRPFQSQVPLTDQIDGDSSLEIVPGFYKWSKHYFPLDCDGRRKYRSKIYPDNPYILGLQKMNKHTFKEYDINKELNKQYDLINNNNEQEEKIDLLNNNVLLKEDIGTGDNTKTLHLEPFCVNVQRIPKNWPKEEHKSELAPIPSTLQNRNNEVLTHRSINKSLKKLYKEHSEFKFNPCKAGDYIIWDRATPHKNGDENTTDGVRQTFYHGYLVDVPLNNELIEEFKISRFTGKHPGSFGNKYSKIEMNNYDQIELNGFGKRLYGIKKYKKGGKHEYSQNDDEKETPLITDRHVEFFKRYGYVVIENAIGKDLIDEACEEIDNRLRDFNLDPNDLSTFNRKSWSNVASSFGGTLEFYWLKTMEKMRMERSCFNITGKLFNDTYGKGEGSETGFEHPFGKKVNTKRFNLYIDRTNYRLPTKLITG